MKRIILTLLIFLMVNLLRAQVQGKSAIVLIETQNEWMHKDRKLRKLLIQDEAMMLKSIQNIKLV